MIDPVSAAVSAEAISGLNTALAGQTLADAYGAYVTDSYNTVGDIQIGYFNVTDNKPAITGDTSHSISQSTEPDPVDAWHDYVENEPSKVSKVTGGIVEGSDVGTFNSALIKLNNGDVKAAAVVAITVDQAYVAASQVLGVSMDAAQLDVELKQKMANSILSCTDYIFDKARDLVTAWWDGVNILLPKGLIDALVELFEEENIPIAGGSEGGYGTASKNGITIPIGTNFEFINGQGHSIYGELDCDYCFSHGTSTSSIYCVKTGSNPTGYWVDGETGSRTSVTGEVRIETVGGVRRYYRTIISYWPSSGDSGLMPSPIGNMTVAQILDIIYNGTVDINPPGEYPEGTAQSQATSYTPATLPSYGGVATSPTTTEDVIPVNIPSSLNTVDSTIDPLSGTDDDVVDDLPPAPLPLPIPDTNPSNPDLPLLDPTIVNTELINTLVESLANTLDPQPPQSSGEILPPLLPGAPDGQGGSVYPSIVPASGSGLVHVYNPTPAEFVAFGSWLWVTYADATIDKIWNNPFDGIIGAFELYSTPQTDGSDNIRSGFLVCPTTSALVRQRYTEIDCGTIIVPEFYGNYLDYSPYSQAYIYLPFIGINEVSIDDIVGHAVNIRYRVDAYNGSCIAMVYVAKNGYENLCYQFAGNCAVEVPLAGGSQASIKAGMMQAEAYARSGMMQAAGNLLGGFGSALLGSLGGVLSSFGGIVSNYANAAAGVEAARVANKSSVQHSGQFGASHGAMGLKIPHIMIRNPIQVKVVNYNDDYGFPAHKRVIIGGCSGYLRVREVNVISAHATDEEKVAIETALKNGVYVT